MRQFLFSATLFATFFALTQAFELGHATQNIYFQAAHKELAAELGRSLETLFNQKFPLLPFKAEQSREPGIFIGIEPAGLDLDTIPDKEFCATHVTDSQLFLWGDDSQRRKGTPFAVYDFLENVCGVRWLWPGSLGTVMEPRPPLRLPAATTLYQPPFDLRLTNSFHYGASRLSAQSLQDLNAYLDHHKVGGSIRGYRGSGFQHAFASLVPRQEHGKKPEFYSLVTPENWIGEPKPDRPTRTNDPTVSTSWQLCTANPEVRRIIVDKLVAAQTTDIQSISPEDGYGFCECDACKQQDLPTKPPLPGISRHPDLTNRMYHFLDDIASQLKARDAQAKVGMFSYSFFSQVPDTITRLPDNVYLSMCYTAYHHSNPEIEQADQAQILGLGRLGAKIIGREYWGTHYFMDLPIAHSRKIDANLKLLRQVQAAGIYGEPGRAFCTRATDLYILAKLAWNPDRKREDILLEFCHAAFGETAAQAMFDYFEKLEEHVSDGNSRYFLEKTSDRNPIFQQYPNGYAEQLRHLATLFDNPFLQRALADLAAARKLARTPAQKARVDFFTSGIRYSEIMVTSISCLQELAAVGTMLPLIQPAAVKTTMEKSQLLEVANRAIAAENARETFLARHANQNTIEPGLYQSAQNITLRPWKALAEIARLDLLAQRYNYLVNGAFEYRQYEWELDPSAGSTCSFATGVNHDADNNFMVQCHAGQGISLQLDLPPGGQVRVRSQRQVAIARTGDLLLSMWMRSEAAPLQLLTARINDEKLDGVWVNRELETDNWHELRFKPLAAAAGSYTLELTLRNTTAQAQRVHLDDLRLKIQ